MGSSDTLPENATGSGGVFAFSRLRCRLSLFDVDVQPWDVADALVKRADVWENTPPEAGPEKFDGRRAGGEPDLCVVIEGGGSGGIFEVVTDEDPSLDDWDEEVLVKHEVQVFAEKYAVLHVVDGGGHGGA